MPSIAPLDLQGHILKTAFLGETPVFASVSGEVHRLDMGLKTTQAHDGILSCVVDSQTGTLVTGGEDGKVIRTDAAGVTTRLAHVRRKWISVVAAGPHGTVAYGVGKTTVVRLADGSTKEFAEERTVEGLAFAPKGLRIAASRYNGVSLHWVGLASPPVDLEWKGAHNEVLFSPDGRFIVTAMQENALHGWKLDVKQGAEARHMRMTGYPAKIKSLCWSAKGKWLASSGAPAAIVWPFSGKDGPMGKAPLELGTRGNSMVTCVACHPAEDVVAVGFIDGMILAVRFGDGKEVVLRRGGKGAITSMDWNPSGKLLAFASDTGDCGLIDIAG